LDAKKSQAERNRLGQFATPTALARDIVDSSVALLEAERPVRFLDPAIGTGSFFSALLHTVPAARIEAAKGFELDPYYGAPAATLWRGTTLDLELQDFTKAVPPTLEAERFNMVVCNPPYVRHHHILSSEKARLQDVSKAACGHHFGGVSGLYCYFLGLAHPWMQHGAIAGWLVPSEFMDVNYGESLKRYLLHKVTLIRIHRFAPDDVQFDDALVSSAVVWFRNSPSVADHSVDLTYGGALKAPAVSRRVLASALRMEPKWTRFPTSEVRTSGARFHLSDFFTIKRGIATGDNKLFILTREQINQGGLPWEAFRPILPSPRYVPDNEIEANQDGTPILDRQLFLLDCRLPEIKLKSKYPQLWDHLQKGKEEAAKRYLCRSRKVWYFQEERSPAPILCTYMGRSDTKSGRPFRFILNHSQAIAANVYLLLYPKPILATAVNGNHALLKKIWRALNDLHPESLLGEGRVYGGGLHKLEPNELANVDASAIADLIADQIPGGLQPLKLKQLSMFERHEGIASSAER
jgi:hypothetical protein